MSKRSAKPSARKEAARPTVRADKSNGEAAVLEKIAAMPKPDRSIAGRIHAIIKGAAPGLTPRLWYGMPAYARDGKIICFFQSAGRFKTRYATFGFMHEANLDDGDMWPTAFAIKKLTGDNEKMFVELVKKAVG